MTSFYLLGDEGLRGRHEDNLTVREPPMIIVHEHRRYERFAESRREANERVFE